MMKNGLVTDKGVVTWLCLGSRKMVVDILFSQSII